VLSIAPDRTVTSVQHPEGAPAARKRRNTGAAPSTAPRHAAMVSGMDAHPIAILSSRDIVMSSGEYAALMRELASLRNAHRIGSRDG
jgi:hypothetical protein